MADLNGNAKYSTPGTGTYANYIAWLDFEKNVDLLNSGVLSVQNIIPGGYTIEFNISAQPVELQAGSGATTENPTNIPFGYLGKGNTYGGVENLYFASVQTNSKVTISDIVVKKNGVVTNDYLMVVGDAEITTSGEVWELASDGPVWQIIDLVPNIPPVESPILSGVGTKTVTFTGVNFNTGTYILQAYNAKEIIINSPSLAPSGIAAAFGIVVKLPPKITKISNPSEIENKIDNYAKFTATFTPIDNTITSYILTDTITPSTGLEYIPTTSGDLVKTTVTQGANSINVTEVIVNGVVTTTIDSAQLVMGVPVNLNLVYKLNSVLPVESIYNQINIVAVGPDGTTPKLYADATVNLININKPIVEKTPLSQEVLIADGERVNFKIVISEISKDPANDNYKIVDHLDSNLMFDAANSSLTVTDNGITTNLPLNYTIDPNNVLIVTIPSNLVPTTGIITFDLSTTIKNAESLKLGDKSINTATWVVDDNSDKQYTSNEAIVLFITKCYQALTDVVASIACQEKSLCHILNAEGEKLQKLLTLNNVTQNDLLNINRSIENMVNSVTLLEVILSKKLSLVQKDYKQ